MAAPKTQIPLKVIFKPLINKVPTFFFHRYYMILALFLLWLLFFDRNNFWAQYKLEKTQEKLENDRRYFQQRIEQVQQQKLDMVNDKEKFAREQYYMKTADEDVFVIEKE